MTDAPRVVWVLGSGFSKPLGGPLLCDLLSRAAAATIQRRYRVECQTVLRVFDGGICGGEGRPTLWGDAEAFLEGLDLACRTERRREPGDPIISTAALRIAAAARLEMNTELLEEVRRQAYRLIALQCHEFVEEGDIESETWIPFVRWSRQVKDDPHHTIITFNYDEVLEKLGFQVAPALVDSPSHAVVLKLHGSLGWRRCSRDGHEALEHLQEPTSAFLTHGNPDLIGIAVPGRSKKERVDGPLADLWTRAKLAIRQADEIYFIGYRFPPSDSQALTELIDAIEASSKSRVVHVVLGQDINHPDVRRLKSLIGFAERNALSRRLGLSEALPDAWTIDVHPLYAQDFVALWRPRPNSESRATEPESEISLPASAN